MDILSVRRRDVSLRAFPRTGIDISASMIGADMLNSDSKMGKDMDILSVRRRDVSLRAFPRTGIDISASRIGVDMLNSDGTMNLVGVLMLNSAS
jgi:hypothetical protein